VSILKHDQHLDNLYLRLKPNYDQLLKKVPIYSKKRRLVAEIDILARKEERYDIYEVKCSHRIYKAKRQLSKIKKLLKKESKDVGNIFFYCGESKKIHNVEELFSDSVRGGSSRKMSADAVNWLNRM
jgi:hypothetical protein